MGLVSPKKLAAITPLDFRHTQVRILSPQPPVRRIRNLRSPGKSRGTSGPLTRRVYCRDGALFGPQSGFRISGIGTVQVNQHQSNGRLRTAHSITSSALASNLSETV